MYPLFILCIDVVIGLRFIISLVIRPHQGCLQSSWNQRTVWKPIYDHPTNVIVMVIRSIPSMILNRKIHYYQIRAQRSKEDLVV
jgi:hypothetical protein